MEELKKEAHAFRSIRENVGSADGPERVFRKVFHDDIARLLSMEDMWKDARRHKPKPLDRDAILDGSFVPVEVRSKEKQVEGALKDQKHLSLTETLELFVDACRRLSSRPGPLSFDKDDDDVLDFVVATSNLRAVAYGIPPKTRFDIKSIAGSIIPAIATTNAIIAGLIVMRAVAIIRAGFDRVEDVYLKAVQDRPVRAFATQPPEPGCETCRAVYVPIATGNTTLGEFVTSVSEWLGWSEVAVYEADRLLSDPDFDDNHARTLLDLGVTRGKFLTVVDEDGEWTKVVFAITSGEEFKLPEARPTIPKRPKRRQPTPSPSPSPQPPAQVAGKKRPAEDELEVELEGKRVKVIEFEDSDVEVL